MADYKETLNLPRTAFPMKASLSHREPQILQRWNEMGLYQALRKHCQGRPKFILHDGPPYANGKIHIGHALNKTLKDIIVKAKTLSGFDAPYVPGWDCHGLPIELNVEKKIGKAGHKVSAKAFRKACREYAAKQVDIQRESFRRLGVLGEWDNPYLTMDFKYEANIIRTLGQVIANGHVHRGYKPVHWCTDCGSALAEAEVEYMQKNSPALDVRFRVLDEEAFWQRCNHVPQTHIHGALSVVIWTTTPWTLPANQAVAVHPQLEYVIVEFANAQGHQEYLCLAEALLKDSMLRYGIQDYKVKAYCSGEALAGLLLQHPFYDRQVPIVLGDHVTTDTGTGAVHTAPGHGIEDYLLGVKYKLPVNHAVLPNGCFQPDTPLFADMHVFKANDKVCEILKVKGNLLHAEMLEHSYPHCWRHKTPLIFRGTPQWFISMEQAGLREQCLRAITETQWLPSWGEARISGMLEQRPDWCISRQRVWGVPLPLFVHHKTGQLHPETPRLLEAVAQRVEAEGADVWFDTDSSEFLGDDAASYEKLTDILDVWFDSGASYHCVLEQREDLVFPADVYLEGSDQHRGWFQTSLLSSVATRGQAPYRTVITHGFNVDAQGRKMSKSLGNVVAPETVINSLGADILRLWTATTDYRAEMSFSDEILKRNADVYRRIRNTARYFLANLDGFDPQQHLLPRERMLALDRWAVDRAYQLQQDVLASYDEFQFHVLCQKIHHFCAVDMGGFYLDIIKDRQYTAPTDSVIRRSAQTAIYHIIEAMVRWLAPVLSFTAEEIWSYIPGERADSVFFATWYEDLFPLAADETMNAEFWQTVIAVRDCVNKEIEQQRVAGNIGAPLSAKVTLLCHSTLATTLQQLGDELRFVLITSAAEVIPADTSQAGFVATELADLWLKVEPMAAEKCIRCWHHRPDVGSDEQHPELCQRCISNVTGTGEKREYA